MATKHKAFAPLNRAQVACNSGRNYEMQGDRECAKDAYERAKDLFEEGGDHESAELMEEWAQRL